MTAAVSQDGRWWRQFVFIVGFLAVFGALQFGYSASRGTVVERVVIDMATIRPAAMAINLISPEEQVRPHEHRLVSPYVKLSVLNGCEGTETLFLLIAAVLAFNAPWRHKLLGILLGGLLVYQLNQVRIVALYYALRLDKDLFSALHGYVGPTLIILLCCLFFLWWIGRIPRKPNDQASSV
jgi:exosortase family protein XrtM